MKNKNYFLAAIVGGITFFLLGWLIYGVVLMEFMNANSGLSADVFEKFNRTEAEFIWWALILANVASGFLIATILSWAQMTSLAAGAKAGAIIGLLIAVSFDFLFYSMTNIFTTTSLVVDIIASTVMTTIGAAIIGWLLGRGNAKA